MAFLKNNSMTTIFFLFSAFQNSSLIRRRCFCAISRDPKVTSYLIEKCGLSEQKAISASQDLHFDNPSRPDSVLNFLSENEFTKTQISNFISKRPLLLLADVDKTLKPKFDFFRSFGLSSPTLAKILSAEPFLLQHSLQKQLIPSFDCLKSIVGTDSNVVVMLKRSTRVLQKDPKKAILPNISLLRDHGVSDSNISLLLTNWPRSFLQTRDRFRRIVEMVEEMGFDPAKRAFVIAVRALTSMSTLTLECKWELFRRWGWSDEEISKAFRQQPHYITGSEKKITKGMDFLVNEMGVHPSYIAKHPVLLMYSLDKRVIPRCSVTQVLQLKGLVKKDISVSTVMSLVEKQFLAKFVAKFEELVPHLSKTYKEMKMNIDGIHRHGIGKQSST